MPRCLDVYLQSDLVGHLSQDTGGQMHFQYGESWLDGSGAAPLSQSLPLRIERFSQKECRGYFGGILPEASNREIVARNLGISLRQLYAVIADAERAETSAAWTVHSSGTWAGTIVPT